MLWENLTCAEFPDAVARSKGVCVVPIGATEKHGSHLPVGTDTMVAEQVAWDAAEKEEVVVFPAFGFGQLLGLQHFDGSVCLSTKLMMNFLTEICREIARSGFKKILLLNGHGGNNALLNFFCESTREEKKDYVVLTASHYSLDIADLLKDIKEQGMEAFPELTEEDVETLESYFAQPMYSGHGCFTETLSLLGTRPELVHLDRMNSEDGCSTHRFDHISQAGMYSPYNWFGNYPNQLAASYHPGANERLGRALHRIRVDKTAEMFRVLKEDEELLKINEEWNNRW